MCTRFTCLAGVPMLLLSLAANVHAVVVISDSTFNITDWTVAGEAETVGVQQPATSGTITVDFTNQQADLSGNSVLHVTGNKNNVGDPTSGGWNWGAAFMYEGASYSPAPYTVVTGVDYSIDQDRAAGTGTNAHLFRLVIEQDGIYYIGADVSGAAHRDNIFDATFTTFSGTNLQAADFHLWNEAGGADVSLNPLFHPDFSLSGGEMRVGIWAWMSGGAAANTPTQSYYDNFSVTFQTEIVPEPQSVVLLLGGVAIVLGAVRLGRQNISV